jgi:hypothetical protein
LQKLIDFKSSLGPPRFGKRRKDMKVSPQEAEYVERWPNTASAWAGWSRFDIPVDRYDTFPAKEHQLNTGVSYLPLG